MLASFVILVNTHGESNPETESGVPPDPKRLGRPPVNHLGRWFIPKKELRQIWGWGRRDLLVPVKPGTTGPHLTGKKPGAAPAGRWGSPKEVLRGPDPLLSVPAAQ